MVVKTKSSDPTLNQSHLRQPNNHSVQLAASLRKLAGAVSFQYGHKYDRAIKYLEDLALNVFWEGAELPRFPFHEQILDMRPIGEPAVPLRAVFGGNRRE